MPSIEFGFTISAFIIFLLLLAAIGLSYFVYRHTIPPVGRATRFLLTLLRSAALFLLLAFLFEPLIRLISTSQQSPAVAVLVDDSKSMGITDRLVNRRAEVVRLLGSPSLKELATLAAARYFTFGPTLSAVPSGTIDSLSLNEDATDISAAYRFLSAEKDQQNIRAVLLISDGAYNLGQNPLYEAEQLGIPLYTIGVGDSSEQKDVLLTKVMTNDIVYNETQAPVDVAIKSSGYNGERLEVILNEGTRELDRKTIVLGPGTREYSVRLSYTPQGEGLKKHTVKISSLPGELTVRNNQKSFFAKVLKSRLRVLMIGGYPSPDLTVIKQTLREERNFEVRSFTQKIPGGFYEGTLSAQPVDSADCIVLIGFPTSSTNATTLELVRAAITERGKPFLFVNGKSLDYARLQMLGGFLPFTALAASRVEDLVFFNPSETQRLNPILAVPASDGLSAWNRLPPIFKTQTSCKAKPEATVLGFSRVHGIVLGDPLILTRNVNKQKSLAVLGYGLWRWRLMSQGTPDTEQLLSTFLSNTITWLTTRDDSRPVKVTATRESYTQGEPAEFLGQVYDAAMRPVDDAQLRVVVKQADKEYETVLRPIGSGRYEGSIDGLTGGDYGFQASARIDGQLFGEDNGRFTVGEANLEFQDTRMNAPLLRQIAFRTGGRYYSTIDIGSLAQDITSQPSFSSRESVHTSTLELWNWRYSLLLLVLLFGAEWFIRKRAGML